MPELCRVAALAYGSPLRTALRAMGDTAAVEGYYCGVSGRANACVCARAALFASCVSLACVGLRCCWGAIERGQLVYGDCAACLHLHVAEVVRRCADRRVGRGQYRRVGLRGPYRGDNAGLSCCGILACKRGAALLR